LAWPGASGRRASGIAGSRRRSKARAAAIACLLALLPMACQTPGSSPPTARTREPEIEASPSIAPRPAIRWHAILVAGDNSIPAFDNAVNALARLLRERGVRVEATFSAAGPSRVAEALVATSANLARWSTAFRAGPGEGCLIFATSHGSIQGLSLVKDPRPSILEPAHLDRIATAACGDAPTVLVISACHSGTFIRAATTAAHRIVLAAAHYTRKSFGCRAERRFTHYDGCLLQEFPKMATWEDLHAALRRCVAAKEATLRERPSEPQAFFGRDVRHLALPGTRPAS